MGKRDSNHMILNAADIQFRFYGVPTEPLDEKIERFASMLRKRSFSVMVGETKTRGEDYQHGELRAKKDDISYELTFERRVDTRCIYYVALRYGMATSTRGLSVDTRVGMTVEPLYRLADLSKIEKTLENAFSNKK
ncbi:MAG: hypothetical protein V1839_01845 [archaeon]